MNIVPTEQTRLIARAMMHTASIENGADAVLTHIYDVPWDQIPALIGIILGALNLDDGPRHRGGRDQAFIVDGCIDCHATDHKQHGRGLCGPCYHRHEKNGTLHQYKIRRRSSADTLADLAELTAQGYDIAAAAQRMGMTRRAVEKAVARQKKQDAADQQATARRRADLNAAMRRQEAS